MKEETEGKRGTAKDPYENPYHHFLVGVLVGIFGGLFITAVWSMPGTCDSEITGNLFFVLLMAYISITFLTMLIYLYSRKEFLITNYWAILAVLIILVIFILSFKFNICVYRDIWIIMSFILYTAIFLGIIKESFKNIKRF
jgi:hypothetical protein